MLSLWPGLYISYTRNHDYIIDREKLSNKAKKFVNWLRPLYLYSFATKLEFKFKTMFIYIYHVSHLIRASKIFHLFLWYDAGKIEMIFVYFCRKITWNGSQQTFDSIVQLLRKTKPLKIERSKPAIGEDAETFVLAIKSILILL